MKRGNKRRRRRRRRHKINRCILKPTEDQLEAAYQAVKSWAKQYAVLIENASGDDFWMNVTTEHGVLSIYWPAFATKEAGEFAIENGRGRVFAFRYHTKIMEVRNEIGVVLDTWGMSRKAAKKMVGYRMWLKVERKYLRWVRRHF